MIKVWISYVGDKIRLDMEGEFKSAEEAEEGVRAVLRGIEKEGARPLGVISEKPTRVYKNAGSLPLPSIAPSDAVGLGIPPEYVKEAVKRAEEFQQDITKDKKVFISTRDLVKECIWRMNIASVKDIASYVEEKRGEEFGVTNVYAYIRTMISEGEIEKDFETNKYKALPKLEEWGRGWVKRGMGGLNADSQSA